MVAPSKGNAPCDFTQRILPLFAELETEVDLLAGWRREERVSQCMRIAQVPTRFPYWALICHVPHEHQKKWLPVLSNLLQDHHRLSTHVWQYLIFLVPAAR